LVVALRAPCFVVVFILGAAGTVVAQEDADHDQAHTSYSRDLYHVAISCFELAPASTPTNVGANFTAAEA